MRVSLCFLLRKPSLQASDYWARWLSLPGGDRFDLWYHCDHESSDKGPEEETGGGYYPAPLDRAVRVPNASVRTAWGNYGVVLAEASLYRSSFARPDTVFAVLLTDWCVPIYSPADTLVAFEQMRKPWICWTYNAGRCPKAELQKVMSRDLVDEWLRWASDPPSDAERAQCDRLTERMRVGDETYTDDEMPDEAHVTRRIVSHRGPKWLLERTESRAVTLAVFLHDRSFRAMHLDLGTYRDELLTDSRCLFVRKVADPVPAHLPLPMRRPSGLSPMAAVYPDDLAVHSATFAGSAHCGPLLLDDQPALAPGCLLLPCTAAAAKEVHERRTELRRRGWTIVGDDDPALRFWSADGESQEEEENGGSHASFLLLDGAIGPSLCTRRRPGRSSSVVARRSLTSDERALLAHQLSRTHAGICTAHFATDGARGRAARLTSLSPCLGWHVTDAPPHLVRGFVKDLVGRAI